MRQPGIRLQDPDAQAFRRRWRVGDCLRYFVRVAGFQSRGVVGVTAKYHVPLGRAGVVKVGLALGSTLCMPAPWRLYSAVEDVLADMLCFAPELIEAPLFQCRA